MKRCYLKTILQFLFKYFPLPISSSCVWHFYLKMGNNIWNGHFIGSIQTFIDLFGPLSFVPSKMRREKKAVIFIFFEKSKNVELQLDWIDTEYVFWKQSESLLNSIVGKAVNDICHIKNFNSLKILHFEYLAAIFGIKNNNNNNNYNDNKCKWMNNHQNYCPFNRLNVAWKNIYLLPC